MKTNTYWPQEQVYLYATFALFPEKISGKILSSVELRNYIPFFFEIDEQTKVLKEFKSRKMLNFKEKRISEDVSEFVIDDIDNGKFSAYLNEYLEMFRNDELIGNLSTKPDEFTALENRLAKYLYFSTRQEPMINPMNIWSDWTSFATEGYPFWELVLASDLISRNTKTLEIGLSILRANEKFIPYAKVAIVKELNGNPEDSTPRRATLVLEAVNSRTRKLVIRLDNNEEFVLKESFRTDLAPHSLMQYLINHPAKNVAIKFARDQIEGCELVTGLGEILRQCNFDTRLKEIFFDVYSRTNVQLKKDAYISRSELISLLED